MTLSAGLPEIEEIFKIEASVKQTQNEFPHFPQQV